MVFEKVDMKKISLSYKQSRWTTTMIWICLLSFMHAMGATDAKGLGLDDMHLKQDKRESDLPVEVFRRSSESTGVGFLGQIEGYDLSQLQPFVGLFSEEYFTPSSDNTKVTDKRSGNVITVLIYRAIYDDGSVALAEKDADGNIVYVELRRSRGTPDLFLVPSASTDPYYDEELQSDDSEFLTFTEDDVDYDDLRSQFRYAEASSPGELMDPTRRLRSNSKTEEQEPVNIDFDYRNGRDEFIASSSFASSSFASTGFATSSSSTECKSFRVVNLAVVFDAEFCDMYGDFETSRRRIMTIVASASFHYERDMCVKLKLTDIYTPESSCSSGNSYFSNFDRLYPCGKSDSFLTNFGRWMKRYRRSLKFDGDATVHMFSGYSPPGGTIGCAYVGAFCNKAYTYGVEYMSFALNPHSQGVVLAHEIGHILSATHLVSNDLYRHVMEPNINNAADGFSSDSINSILNFLNDDAITCDSFSNEIENPRCSVFQEHPRDPECISTSSQTGRYACFDSSSILEASSTSPCPFPVPIKRISRCDGQPRTGRRLSGDNSDSPFEFKSSHCGASCILVSNLVCFRASGEEQGHSITFSAYADFDVSKSFQTDVLEKDSDDCDVATTRCVS